MSIQQDDEPIGTLEGPSAIDRVIDETTAKTFNITAVLAELDNAVKVQFENPVPVKNEDGKLIGFATLHRSGHRVLGELFIDYATPERLTIETKAEKLYGRAAGTVSVFLVGGSDTFSISHVLVTSSNEGFPRPPLGEPIL